MCHRIVSISPYLPAADPAVVCVAACRRAAAAAAARTGCRGGGGGGPGRGAGAAAARLQNLEPAERAAHARTPTPATRPPPCCPCSSPLAPSFRCYCASANSEWLRPVAWSPSESHPTRVHAVLCRAVCCTPSRAAAFRARRPTACGHHNPGPV